MEVIDSLANNNLTNIVILLLIITKIGQKNMLCNKII